MPTRYTTKAEDLLLQEAPTTKTTAYTMEGTTNESGSSDASARDLREENALLRSNLDHMVEMMTGLRTEIQELCSRQAIPQPRPTPPTPLPVPPLASTPTDTDTVRPREKLPTLPEFDGK